MCGFNSLTPIWVRVVTKTFGRDKNSAPWIPCSRNSTGIPSTINTIPPHKHHHYGVPFAPPTVLIQWIAPIWRVGGHPKGLAEGTLAGFYINRYNNREINFILQPKSGEMTFSKSCTQQLQIGTVTTMMIRLVLILAGALFYATVTFVCFCFFCSVQKNSILSIYHTSEVHTSLQKKVYSFPPQNKGQAELHPPIFITAHTHPVHGGVWAVLRVSISAWNLALK